MANMSKAEFDKMVAEFEAAKAANEALKTENEKLKLAAGASERGVYFKVTAPKPEVKNTVGEVTQKASAGGLVSVYNLQRFPVTLGKEQWEKFIGCIPALQAFMATNIDKLTTKAEQLAAKAAAKAK